MNTIFSFTLLSEYAPQIAVVLSLFGAVILLRSMLSQNQATREQKTLVAQLHAYVAQSASDQIEFHDQLSALQEQCASLLARQQMVEKHGSDSQRIDLAMRMLKRGNADKGTLHELGLSASEIKLLLHLHSAPVETNKTTDVRKPAGKVTELGASRTLQAASPAEKAFKDNTSKEPVSTQGRALAQLFAAQAST